MHGSKENELWKRGSGWQGGGPAAKGERLAWKAAMEMVVGADTLAAAVHLAQKDQVCVCVCERNETAEVAEEQAGSRACCNKMYKEPAFLSGEGWTDSNDIGDRGAGS